MSSDSSLSSTSSPATVVADYLTAFLSGDIAKARSAMTDDFTFRAPLVHANGTKEVFFAGAEHKSALIRDFRILRLWQDGDEVSCVYEIDVETPAGRASMPLHEWHLVRDGRIAAISMIFDTHAPAADLIRNALHH